jgi:hypothetical protein
VNEAVEDEDMCDEESVEDVLPDIEVYEEDESENEDDEYEEDCEFNNGFVDTPIVRYSTTPFPQRLRRRNILTQQSRVLSNPATEKEAFLLFYNIDIVLQVLRETNRKAREVRRESHLLINSVTKEFTHDEIEAGIAIILRAGLDRDNFTSLQRLWDRTDSRPFYRIVMGLQRFKFLLRCMRFDNFRNRQVRQATDRLAAVREVWTMFNDNLRNVYVPQEALTVDEQLVGYRGVIPGRTYMPTKPRKYGLKWFWVCESKTGFALNGLIYSGRQQNEPARRNLATDVVLELCSPFSVTGRDIYTDRLVIFTLVIQWHTYGKIQCAVIVLGTLHLMVWRVAYLNAN